MSIISDIDARKSSLLDVAKKMMIAARTAPKGKGNDNLELAIVDGEDIVKIAERMKEISERENTTPAFARDADNILNAEVVLLLGTRINPLELAYCGLCGFSGCEEKKLHVHVPCTFNTSDLGIALGSAVSVAMDYRVDNRVMYTVGMAVKELGIMGDTTQVIYGVPLSATSKNLFFDRKN